MQQSFPAITWLRFGFSLAISTGLQLVAFGQVSTFAPMVAYSTGMHSAPNSTVIADVNGDGKQDALVVNNDAGTLAVLLGDGRGRFSLQDNAPLTGPPSSSPKSLVVADVNGDGKLDVLTANQGSDTLGVLLGDGEGKFTLQAFPSAGIYSTPVSVAVADINGDGKPDAVTADFSIGALSLFLGDGTGGFIRSDHFIATGEPDDHPVNVVITDVNSDNKPDLLVITESGGSLSILIGDGKGGFTLKANASTGYYPYGLALSDVNGDGKLDVLTCTNGFSALGVLLSDGNGNFVLQKPLPPAGTQGSDAFSVVAADVNGDGKEDALLVDFHAATLNILLGDGKGGFRLQTPVLSTGIDGGPFNVAIADVNSDGKPDALVANARANTLGVFLNTTTLLPTRAALPGTSARLYPNPARTAATLTLTGLPATATQAQATLLDAVGRTVVRQKLAATGGTVPLAGLAPGLYVVQLAALDAAGQALGALPAQRLAVE